MNTKSNPYSPPEARLEDQTTPGQLMPASRVNRLIAAIVDGIILMVVIVPVLFLLGFYEGITQGQEPGLLAQLGAVVFSLMVWTAINYRFLTTKGQTVGKKLQHIRMVNMDGNVPDLVPMVLRRYAVFHFATLIPVIGNFILLVDVLFIFGQSKRCLHDRLANTRVVQV